ncbi:reverse transcriptase [Gossypium australe]|uniref:Reverse transcriptase n=1 Tax=Gossypium australe TaxID=47621 RepID=A0A5B6VZM6_9ROSI|nr:reverse transcriptase [Gossypium australe]
MFCVRSSKIAPIWNGQRPDEFQHMRGLHQGDPLSTYLFILAMEKLSHMILKQKSMIGFVSSILCQRLATFCKGERDIGASASGLTVNLEKSKLFISPNIHSTISSRLSQVCGIPLTNDLDKYLGVPLIHKRASKEMYCYIIDRVMKKLDDWKGKILSFAGRGILIRSTMSVIPLYTMQSALLPILVNLLLGESTETSRNHLVSWLQVCCLKEKGCLGL